MRRNVERAAFLVREVDPWLTISFLILLCFGTLMVYSASMADAYNNYGTPYYYLQRQAIWVVVGFGALFLTFRVRYHYWERWSFALFVLAFLSLGLVLVPHLGHASHGSSRWLQLNSTLAIEPSELIKLTLILYMASWLPTKGERLRELRSGAGPYFALVGLICILIIKQPDLGTAIVVSVTGAALFYLAGGALSHLAMAVGAGGLGALVMAQSASYRNGRITAFLNPWSDPSGSGFHTIQALVALRYGGLFGRGLGNSVQKYVLPAPHTDSILAIIGEEWGLVGAVGVLAVFLIIGYRGMRIAAGAPDTYGRLLAGGITCWITFQALMNFAVITSSVPFTGVPLPFVSYGGTSLVISMAAVGILLNISRHSTGRDFARQHGNHGRGNGRPRVPRVIYHSAPEGSRRRPSFRTETASARRARLQSHTELGELSDSSPVRQ